MAPTANVVRLRVLNRTRSITRRSRTFERRWTHGTDLFVRVSTNTSDGQPSGQCVSGFKYQDQNKQVRKVKGLKSCVHVFIISWETCHCNDIIIMASLHIWLIIWVSHCVEWNEVEVTRNSYFFTSSSLHPPASPPLPPPPPPLPPHCNPLFIQQEAAERCLSDQWHHPERIMGEKKESWNYDGKRGQDCLTCWWSSYWSLISLKNMCVPQQDQ